MEAILAGILSSLVASAISGGATGIYKRIQNNKSLEEKLRDAFEKAVCRYFQDELQQEKVIYHDTDKYIQMLKAELDGHLADIETEKYKKLYDYFKEEIAKNQSLADYVEIKELGITQELLEQNSREIKGLITTYGDKIIAQNDSHAEKLDNIMELLTRMGNSSSNPATIRSLISDYNQDIRELKIKSAYRHLENIHQSLVNESNNDELLHAAVQCSMGICARFISNTKSQEHYQEAYRLIKSKPITDTALYVQILEGLIYWECKEKHDEEARAYSEELKEVNPDNGWGYVPALITADDLNAAYQAIPERVHKFQALTNAVMIGCKAKEYQMGLDIDAYAYQNLTELTYDNFSLWVFDMSVAATKFARQFTVRQNIHASWNREAEDLYNITHRYLDLLQKTELANLMPDTVFLENLTGYLNDRDERRLVTMEQEKGKPHFKELFYLGYAMMLMDCEKYPKTLELVKGYGEDASAAILNMRLVIAFRSGEMDEAKAAVKEVAEKKRNIPDHLLPNYMQTIKLFFSELEPYTKDITISNPQSKFLFDQFMLYLRGEEVDLQRLQNEESQIHPAQYPFLATIYKDKIGLDNAIQLLGKCVDPAVLDVRTLTLLDFFKEDKKYAVARYHLLKHLRENGETNVLLLRDELEMAEIVQDYEAINEITEILMPMLPKDHVVLCLHLKALHILGGKKERLINYEPKVYELNYTNAKLVATIARIYIDIQENAFAVEFLYRAIALSRNQEIKDFFYTELLKPQIQKVVYAPHERVEMEDVVQVEDEKGVRIIDVLPGSVYEVMIGKRVGECVSIPYGRERKLTIKEINNKYYNLIKEIRVDVEEGNSKNIHMFSSDDIIKAPDPLAALHKLIGGTGNVIEEHQKKIDSYQNGDTPLTAFIRSGDEVASMLNILFDPSFTVCSLSPELYKPYAANFATDNIEIVLDMSSLMNLTELSRRFGWQPTHKFIIPISLKLLLRRAKIKEECGDFSLVHQAALDNLTVTETDDNTTTLWKIVNSMLEWIDLNCDVMVVEERLFTSDTEEHTASSVSEMDSVLLSQNRLLLTEDWTVQKMTSQMLPSINVSNWMDVRLYEKLDEVYAWMLDCGNIGGRMSPEYIVNQYKAMRNGEKNSYKTCIANISANPSNFRSVLEAGEEILADKSDVDGTQYVEEMIEKLLQAVNERARVMLLGMASMPNHSDELLKCMYEVYRTMNAK